MEIANCSDVPDSDESTIDEPHNVNVKFLKATTKETNTKYDDLPIEDQYTIKQQIRIGQGLKYSKQMEEQKHWNQKYAIKEKQRTFSDYPKFYGEAPKNGGLEDFDYKQYLVNLQKQEEKRNQKLQYQKNTTRFMIVNILEYLCRKG